MNLRQMNELGRKARFALHLEQKLRIAVGRLERLEDIVEREIPWERYKVLLQQRRKLKQELKEAKLALELLEKIVEQTPDCVLRSALRARYIEGRQWQEVAADMGHMYNPDSLKKQVMRYLATLR